MAVGFGGRADERADFHQGLVELGHLLLRQDVFGDTPEKPLTRGGMRVWADAGLPLDRAVRLADEASASPEIRAFFGLQEAPVA